MPMAMDNAYMPAPAPQWGRVVRGVVAITAIALAAVVMGGVAFYGTDWLLNGMAATPEIGQVFGVAGHYLSMAAGAMVGAAEALWAAAVAGAAWAWNGIVAATSATPAAATVTPLSFTPEQATLGVKAATIGGAVLGGSVAAKATLLDPSFMHGSPDSTLIAQQGSSTAAKLGQHAVEHEEERAKAGWRRRIIASQFLTSRPALTPREGSFAAQLTADRAALDTALGEQKR